MVQLDISDIILDPIKYHNLISKAHHIEPRQTRIPHKCKNALAIRAFCVRIDICFREKGSTDIHESARISFFMETKRA